METSQIHIVLATYNGEKYIREQIDSVLANSFSDFTIEVCDDGSTDKTKEIVNEYVKSHSNISLHENERNLGYVMNFLEGVKRSASPYIMLCDQDDIWHADKIEKTYNKMKELEAKHEKGEPLLVFSDAMNFDSENGQDIGSFHKSSHLNTKKVDMGHLFMENKCIGCTVMVNRAVLKYLTVLPEQIRVHDWWLAMICSAFGGISYLDETTLQYRQHSGNMIGGSSFKDYFKSRIADISAQRKALTLTFMQGEEFENQFGWQVNEKQRKMLHAFSSMRHATAIGKRYNMIRYGFCKSGFVRNVALFLLL